ncbi:MAG: hypothetical protein CMJ34_12210 [Phycisphaerae bacterium]|nr:hypothetical protein [Phycisphaerae bacterium]
MSGDRGAANAREDSMMSRTLRPGTLHGLRATAILAAFATTQIDAGADIAFTNYVDRDTFAFIVQDMPDFDQIRTGDLPNDGVCYCGPASTSDLLGYVATHGYPDVDPGIPFVSWYNSGSYSNISNLLSTIGTSTGTSSGASGTSCGVSQSRLHDELVDRIGDRFTVRNSLWSPADGYAPDTAEIAYRGWRDQAVGLMLYGRWAGDHDSSGRWVSNQRRGGHFEAVNRAIAGGGLIKLGLRNPWTGDSGTSQSEFATHWFDVERQATRINGNDVTVDQLNPVYTSGDESRMRILEGYLSIAPKACYTWDDFTASLLRLTPSGILWSELAVREHAYAMPGVPSRVAFGPSDLTIASIVDGRIIRTARAMAEGGNHEEIRLRAGGWRGATDLAFDQQRRLHVVGGDRLATLNWDTGELLSMIGLPGEGSSIAIENGIVHVLIPEMEMVAAVNQGPNGPFVVELPLPDDALVLADSTIDMLPGGRLFLLSDGTVNPMQITDAGFQRLWIPVPRDGDWNDIAVDDLDTLCMVDRNGLVEAYRVGANGFERNGRHALDGTTAGRRIAVARSTSNRNPDLEDLIDSTDLDIDDRVVELDCLGDLNFDRVVDSADIGLMLGEWGAPRSIADLDRNGTVDSADLGLLLGAFGQCR